MAQPAVATPAAAPSPLAAAAPGVLEMEARVEGNPVVFAGRTVCCRLRLANRSAAPQQLAWASAQVHCQCSVNAARIALPPQPHARGSGESYAFTPTRGQLSRATPRQNTAPARLTR